MNKENKAIEELLGFYFIWFPIELLAINAAKYINITNYDIKIIFIMQLIYYPLKIIFNYLSSNNIEYFNKNIWKKSVIYCGLCYLIFNTYKFKSIQEYCKYLIIIGLIEKTKYYLFQLFKKIIKEFTLNKVYKILEHIFEFGRIIFCILFYLKIFGR